MPGRAASSSAMRDAGRDRQHERVVGQSDGAALSSAAGTSPGFTATTTTSASATAHAGLGTTRTPGNAVLEDAAALGVDLGDRERVGLPAGVEQAADEGLAHAPAAEQRDALHERSVGEATRRRRRTCDASLRRETRGRARGTSDRVALPRTTRPPAPRAHVHPDSAASGPPGSVATLCHTLTVRDATSFRTSLSRRSARRNAMPRPRLEPPLGRARRARR